MAASQKVHVISTKCFMCINWGHYVIYLQNMKFVQSILWPEGAYTDATYADDTRIMIPYSDEIVNHNYIGLLGCIPNEPKTSYLQHCMSIFNPLRSLWCCSNTMDPLGPFWALAPLIIGLEPWNQVHFKENWILRKVLWSLVTWAERPIKGVAWPSKYVSSRKLNLNLFYIR